MWYGLLSFALLFTISGLDDLFFDMHYWIRLLWRIWKTRHYSPLTYEKLVEKKEQRIAVLVPCWQESNVIGAMLTHNTYSIDYQNYTFFVGVYPNDSETVAEVQALAKIDKRIQCCIGEVMGPTNKGANLNQIYNYIKSFEKTLEQPYTIFVMHDSEDIIHPLSFKLYNYLIPRKDMIQIPILPLQVSHWNFTHWLYADEFAENHTKNIIVRESIKAHVPSAGVGTAYYRAALETLEHSKHGGPFAIDSLTEDYRMSLALRVCQLKQIFVTQHIVRLQWKKRLFFRGYVLKPVKEVVAVRALFPQKYSKSIRQKARWIMGIVFQEWEYGLWPDDWSVRYTLAHDRKTFITHFINGLGYLILFYWILYEMLSFRMPEYPSLYEQFNLNPWSWWMIIVSTILMGERVLQRTIATYRIYGFIPASLVIPRLIYGNILNLHAVLRAYSIYFFSINRKLTKRPIAWDKTEHSFPSSHLLVPYRKKLGDLLLDQKIITAEQLQKAVLQQQKTGERLGRVLCRLQFITESELLKVISIQYNLPLFSKQHIKEAQHQCISLLPKKIMKWLLKQGVNPVGVNPRKKILTIGIDDPTNEALLGKIMKYVSPYKTQFTLIDVV
jgi:adsorption protein B